MNTGYQKGVNLGGWISQYGEYNHEHFKTFITEADIRQIASWGMDHVRLPVDHPVIVSEEGGFTYREEGFEYIDNCIEWCQRSGLNLVLDLHRAPGFSFTNTLQESTASLNTLFTEPVMQARFIDLWETITRRYMPIRDALVFELINEVVLPESEPWNHLAGQTIEAVHNIDPERAILIGGNRYNAVSELKNLKLFENPRVFYTFHFYEPLLFPHQKAPWVTESQLWGQELHYPGELTGLDEFLEKHPEFADAHGWLVGKRMDRDLLHFYLQPAFDWMQANQRPLYCGEYGVIERAPVPDQLNWMRDFVSLLDEHGIGQAVWSYKQMDFGLVDGNGQVVNEEMIRIVSG
jgi:endoglucanase